MYCEPGKNCERFQPGRKRMRILRWTLILVIPLPALLAQEALLEPPAEAGKDQASVVATSSQSEPLTLSDRYKWAAKSTFSPAKMTGYAISSAWSTMTDKPEEYGPHWDGFGKRVGMRVAGSAVGSVMETSLGALWGEDPRYVRAAGQPLKNRLGHILKMTFLARNERGEYMPAYARYISVPANSYLSNLWRADSEANRRHAEIRIPMAFVTRVIGNTFTEFWPDATKWMHRK